jgi:DNA-directed RNA polymerase subunit RPC12/RpoP
MICIRCQHDSKYPERKDTKTCPKCGGRFAFEPRDSDPFSDKAFQSAIDKVSSQGQVKWGVEHLYYELRRRKKNPRVFAFALVVLTFGNAFVARWISPLALVVTVPLSIWLLSAAYNRPLLAAFPREQFERMWDRWGVVHGKPKGVIARRLQDDRPARAPEPDIGDYSFDRAVICDRARTVDLLLANNFHFENNCAVLSVGGYPRQAFETVRRMLRRNPRLEVFVLHDITPEGCRLAHRLAHDPEWFKGMGVRIVDVGLRPVHAAPFNTLFEPSNKQIPTGGGISAEEAGWLSRHQLELAVIRPEQIVKRLFRAMSQSQQAARAPSAVAEGRGTRTRLPAGATGAAAGAAMLPTAAMAGQMTSEELARQKKQAAAQGTSGDAGSSSSSDWDFGWEVDSDSFSSDADASDGGADSFG